MTGKDVKAAMLADVARSGLTEADTRRMALKTYTRAEAEKLGLPRTAAGYALPYFGVDGKVSKFFRYRILEDTRDSWERAAGGKALRYLQAKGTPPGVYFPPGVDWRKELADADRSVLLTEGEKKSAATCKAGFLCIGLGGVWSFRSKAQNERLLPVLAELPWKNRDVFICFDSDAASNAEIRIAEQHLAVEIGRLGARVHVVRLPPAGNEKQGLDDYLTKHGAEDLKALLDNAETYAESAALHQLNNEVLFIRNPGIIHVYADDQRVTPSVFKESLFANRSYTRIVDTANGTKLEQRKTAADWLAWPARAEARSIVYRPGQPPITVDGCMNGWRPSGVEPSPGDVKPWKELLDHLFIGEPEGRRWFERWAAYPLQHPGAKLRTAVVLWGRATGTGKSSVGFTLGDLYGKNFTTITDEQIEKQDFNDWAANRQFVMGDDITGRDSRKIANALKVLITRERVYINIKYLPHYEVDDCINYLFTSNDPDAFYLDANDRRFFIHEVTAGPLPQKFYDRYDGWRRSEGGRAALLHHLLTLPLDGFNQMERAPNTRAKEDMVAVTRTDLEDWLAGVLENPAITLGKYGGGDIISVTELAAAYDPTGNQRVSPVLMARKLRGLGAQLVGERVRVAGGLRASLYALRNAERWIKATPEAVKEAYQSHRPKEKR